MTTIWQALEPDLETIFLHVKNPLQALADGDIPGIVLRGAYPVEHCEELICRFLDQNLIWDPENPKAGNYNEVIHHRGTGELPLRIDIGSSLANFARHQTPYDDDERNKEAFLEHAAATWDLFQQLFDGLEDPVECLYNALSALAVGKEVKVAYEPDGRQYGPAIFRIHYAGQEYLPHINHARISDKLFNFQASRFDHNFAGLICMRNPAHKDASPHALIHRCVWTPEIEEHLSHGTYDEYAAQKEIEQFEFNVEPGDFYLFNSGLIHVVKPFESKIARIVLATFIGYSQDDDEIFVWS